MLKTNDKIILIFLLLLITLHSNSEQKLNFGNVSIHKGAGNFIFRHTNEHKNKPIRVYYYLPAKIHDKTKIVFFMAGATRNAKYHRDRFLTYASKYGFILIAPTFSKKHFSSRYYQGGGILNQRGKINPEKYWTYSAIEHLFDYVKQLTRNKTDKYFIFGHSAGGQFVHRMIIFKPSSRIKLAVAANAGHYTFPDFNKSYLYGLKRTHVNKKSLQKSFSKKLIILLGDKDTKTSGKYIPRSRGALAQGKNRFERGINFYTTSYKQAKRMGMRFNWILKTLKGVGHSSAGTYIPLFPKIFKPVIYKATNKINTGIGRIAYNADNRKIINLWYYKPYRTNAKAKIIFLMHSGSRNAKGIRDRGIKLAIKYNFILIAPEFSKKYYSNTEFFSGNVYKKWRKKLNPKEVWTFAEIDKIFQFIKKKSGLKQKHYYMFGNTSSGFFPIRMAMFYPECKAKSIAVANLRYYPIPTYKEKYPYGLKGTLLSKNKLKKFYSKNILIMSGNRNKQKKIDDKYLLKQGGTYYDRALNFYIKSRQFARKNNFHFNWKFVHVRKTRWSYTKMLERALMIWYN